MPVKSSLRSKRSRNRMVAALALMSAVMAGGFAHAAAPCNGVEQQLNESGKRAYAELVAGSVKAHIKPSQVKVQDLMESGSWSAVRVSTPVADGVLFFQARQFKDVWGGWADRSEQPELVDWAKNLGAPDSLARCFAHIVTE